MAEKKYYWLKMTDQFFEDKAIKKLRKIAGGDTYTIIYLKMLLTAIKQGKETEFELFKVVENVEAMRLQIIFDGKPKADVRAVLKKHGFKWAPSQGAWQRMLNPAGKYALNRVKEELEVMQNDN